MSNDTSLDVYQAYLEARQRENMDFIEPYSTWAVKHKELATLKEISELDTWENSEHNPSNYSDFDSLDENTKDERIRQGKKDYWADSERLESQIRTLETLLMHPDEIERVSDGDDKPTEYYNIDD